MILWKTFVLPCNNCLQQERSTRVAGRYEAGKEKNVTGKYVLRCSDAQLIKITESNISIANYPTTGDLLLPPPT